MNQIPSEGEYCSSCFMLHHLFDFGVCLLYKEVPVDYNRLLQCLSDRPQIVTSGKECPQCKGKKTYYNPEWNKVFPCDLCGGNEKPKRICHICGVDRDKEAHKEFCSAAG